MVNLPLEIIYKLIFITLLSCWMGCLQVKAETPRAVPTPPPIDQPLFATPPYNDLLSKEGIDLIVYYESGGQSYYNKKLKHPTVPPGFSGITIGIGFDLQFYSKDNILRIWHKLKQEEAYRLSLASGLNHSKSLQYLPKVKDIIIEWDLATEVFNIETIPQYYALALRTFPGLDSLCPNAQAAVVSVVFNRGNSLIGPSRSEMRDLKTAISKGDYKAMAKAVTSMKRLWVGKNMDGLLKRRDAEAKLILSCCK